MLFSICICVKEDFFVTGNLSYFWLVIPGADQIGIPVVLLSSTWDLCTKYGENLQTGIGNRASHFGLK